MAYRKHVFSHSTVFPTENDGFWTFADVTGDGAQDLVYIKTQNTKTDKVEIHVADYESSFQKKSLVTSTILDIDNNGTYLMQDWDGDGRADLVYIKTRNTGLDSLVKLFVVDAASGFKNLAFHATIHFDGCKEDGFWTMTGKGDLVYIKAKNSSSDMIQYYVVTKVSEYKDHVQYTIPGIDTDTNGTWHVFPALDGEAVELYYVSPKNIGTGLVEIYTTILGREWRQHVVDFPSSFAPGETGRWLMVKYTHQEQPDLAYIKTKNTASGKVEVRIVSPQEVEILPYTRSSQNVRLDPSARNVLHADLQRNNGSWRNASIDLNVFLGNIDGKFTWDKKGFYKSARQVSLNGSLLTAELQKKDGSWVQANFDLQGNIMNDNGVFRAIDVPIILAVPREHQEAVLNHLSEALDHPNSTILQVLNPLPPIHLQARNEPEGVSTFYVNAGINSSGTVLWTCTGSAEMSVLHVANGTKGKPLQQVHLDVLGADIGSSVGAYTGIEANVSLVKAQAGPFDMQLGLGVDEGIGIKDESVQVEVEGCGISLGRKVSISVFGSSFGIDFGRFFG